MGDARKEKGCKSESLHSTSSSSSQRKHRTGKVQPKKTRRASAETQGLPEPSEAADQRDRLQTLLSGLEVDEEDDTEEIAQSGVWADPPPELPRASATLEPTFTGAAASRSDRCDESPDTGTKKE